MTILIVPIVIFLVQVVQSQIRLEMSSKGYLCESACKTTGSYWYCYVGYNEVAGSHQWQYCSSENGHDYKGNKCENECDYHGGSYLWCRIADGNWGYCSKVEYKELEQLNLNRQFKDIHGNVCIGAAQTYIIDEKGSKCKTTVGEGYFSRLEGYSPTGKKCKGSCGQLQGTKYFWCKVESGGWDYCSPP